MGKPLSLMQRSRARFAAASLALALLGTSLPAHAFRCGTKVISRGDQAAKMLHFCGEPDSVQSRLAQRSIVADFGRIYPGIVEDVVIEEWTYNLGPYKLMRLVRIENGVVAKIEQLGYGY